MQLPDATDWAGIDGITVLAWPAFRRAPMHSRHTMICSDCGGVVGWREQTRRCRDCTRAAIRAANLILNRRLRARRQAARLAWAARPAPIPCPAAPAGESHRWRIASHGPTLPAICAHCGAERSFPIEPDRAFCGPRDIIAAAGMRGR